MSWTDGRRQTSCINVSKKKSRQVQWHHRLVLQAEINCIEVERFKSSNQPFCPHKSVWKFSYRECCFTFIAGRAGIELFRREAQSESSLLSSGPSSRPDALFHRRPRLVSPRWPQITLVLIVRSGHRVAMYGLYECQVVEPLRRPSLDPTSPRHRHQWNDAERARIDHHRLSRQLTEMSYFACRVCKNVWNGPRHMNDVVVSRVRHGLVTDELWKTLYLSECYSLRETLRWDIY